MFEQVEVRHNFIQTCACQEVLVTDSTVLGIFIEGVYVNCLGLWISILNVKIFQYRLISGGKIVYQTV